MPKIETLYVVNHSHTDIGFTDEQDLCFRQHREFVDQALDLCEATADYPAEARYHWTCEVTGMTEKYLDAATDAQRDRFRTWMQRGQIDIAGMQYNQTPLLGMEQMIRSLYPVRRMRDRYGVHIRSAMQCDVNGVSWAFADLLPAIGIDFLTMAVNPIRGSLPRPVPGAFWWEGPAGGKLLVWNGYHYLFGRSIAKLGDWRFAEANITREIAKLDADESYPFDFLYIQATHPIRVDNGPPDPRMPDFVRDWNAMGHEPTIRFTTPSAFADMLRARHGDELPTQRGDWLDWWSDGVASSAYETGVNRATHELLRIAEALAVSEASVRDTARTTRAFELASLYDEHTWGSFASIAEPQTRWTKGQWNHKASFAYRASSEAHDLVARSAEAAARRLATPPAEGVFNLGDLDPAVAYPQDDREEVLVYNALPWARTVVVEQPELRGGAAPAGVLDCFFPRDIPWGGARPLVERRAAIATLPANGFAFVRTAPSVDAPDLAASGRTIENAHAAVTVDPVTGALASWIDKATGKELAGSWSGYGLGQYVYETVDDPAQRDALFLADFSAENFGTGNRATRWNRTTVDSVTVDAPVFGLGDVAITARVTARGIHRGQVTYRLRTDDPTLDIDWLLDKQAVDDAEAVFIAFPFALGAPQFRADINGMPITPEAEQLAGTVKDWYPIGHWVDVSDGDAGVTMVLLDAPLVHLGGITTGRWADRLEPDGPTVMSWALHNHWMVNFQSHQAGEIPLRYRLRAHRGRCNDVEASRFGLEQATPVVTLRDRSSNGTPLPAGITVEPSSVLLTHMKPAEFGDGTILRLQNLGAETVDAIVHTAARAAWSATPDERDIARLVIDDAGVRVPVAPREVQTVRIVT